MRKRGSNLHGILTILLIAFGFVIGCCPARAAAPADTTLTLSVDDQQRTAYLHVPANLDPAQTYPLVIGYHGGAGNAPGYINQSGLFVKGEQSGFIVVCPEGTSISALGNHRVWNSGREYARSSGNADDVQFTRRLIDKIATLYPVDAKRIYATGFSNGGQMAYRVALEMSDRIAAIAPMSGGRLSDGLQPARPVPVLHVHGTADGVYPLEGGLGPHSIGRVPHVSISSVIFEWCKFDNARLMPQTTPHNGWELRTHDGPAPVVLVLVNGMGHQIAGGNDNRLPQQTMKDTPDAMDLALKFFADHPMP
jgi:polyhydroxybutyrate depolymerase